MQHRDDQGVRQTLRFTKQPSQVVTIEECIPWAAEYYVSPDEHWVLRIQKSGSGDNISFLYQLDAQGRLWRMEEQIGQLGFAYLASRPGVPQHMYHTGIEFNSWDLRTGQLHFTIDGTDNEKSGNGVSLPLTYDLRHEVIMPP